MVTSRVFSRGSLLLGGLFLLSLLLAWAATRPREADAQGVPPPAPVVYSGTVTVGGASAPDGLQIVGRILDYQSGRRRPGTASTTT